MNLFETCFEQSSCQTLDEDLDHKTRTGYSELKKGFLHLRTVALTNSAQAVWSNDKKGVRAHLFQPKQFRTDSYRASFRIRNGLYRKHVRLDTVRLRKDQYKDARVQKRNVGHFVDSNLRNFLF